MIDFHTHCFPDSIAKHAMDKLSNNGEMEYFTDGTAEDLRFQMQRAGIKHSVVLNIATKPGQEKSVNDFAMEINSEELIAFGSINPKSENAIDEVEKLKKRGLKGVKFHPEYQSFDMEDKSFYPIFEACYEMNLIMSFHSGKDIAFADTNYAHPAAMLKLCKHLPEAKIVLAHLGGWQQWVEVSEILVESTCFMDTSFTAGFIDPNLMADIIINHGIGKIVFGSDAPWASFKQSIDFIDGLSLSSADKDQIFYENAAQLLGL